MKKNISYNKNSDQYVYDVTIEGEFMGGGSASTKLEAEEKANNLILELSDRINSDKLVEYHREPTKYEIKFGEGATHYRSFPMSECVKPDGRLKKWFVADDGLRYYR